MSPINFYVFVHKVDHFFCARQAGQKKWMRKNGTNTEKMSLTKSDRIRMREKIVAYLFLTNHANHLNLYNQNIILFLFKPIWGTLIT